MARVTNMYSAHWVGSSGFATFKQLGGQTVVSQKSLGPTNEPTDIQIGNEKSMATLVEIGRIIKGAIDIGFNELKVKNTPKKCRNTAWGAFIGENRKYENNVFDYTIEDSPVFEPANMMTGKGTIYPTVITSATGDVSDQKVTVTYADTIEGPGQGSLDKSIVVLYNETKDEWFYNPNNVGDRAGGVWEEVGAAFPTPFIITDVIRAYLVFQGATLDGSITVLTGKESDSTNEVVTLSA